MKTLHRFITIHTFIMGIYSINIYAAPLSDELVVLHNATIAEMNAITTPTLGSLIFNTDDKETYERNATDLTHQSHFSGGDSNQWLPTNFTFTLADTQINDIRAASTEGKQRYHGTCNGVIHHNYQVANYAYAFGFRFHHGFETVHNQQNYPNTNISVSNNGCRVNNNNIQSSTDFDIIDIRVPIINVHSRDNGNNGEQFGSPLTTYPAWLR